MEPPTVLLFGDVVVDTSPALRKLYKAASSRPSLAHFLHRASSAIKAEYQCIPANERTGHEDFRDLPELAERHARQPNVLAATTILGVVQLGEYLVLAEDRPSILNSATNQVYHFGVCQGALPGAVACAARDTSQIVSLGVEVLKITLRLGVHLVRRSRAVEDDNGSWVVAVLALEPTELQKRLDKFNEAIPIAWRAYTGISTKTWSSVFGPPSTLERLKAHDDFADVPKSDLPNGVAAHAQHLPPLDVDAILGQSPALSAPLPRHSLVSLGTASIFPADTMRDLLASVIGGMSQQQQQLDRAATALGDLLTETSTVTLTVVGPTPHETLVLSRLRERISTVHLASQPQRLSDQSASGDIAVVGMSGRFPQSNSLKEFWNLLLDGIDTCEEIPSSRFPIDEYYREDTEDDYTTTTRFGCFLRDPGAWDNAFFNISPKEATQMDPLHRLLLTTTYEALQMSGYAGGSDAVRVATFIGQTTQDWWTVNDQHGPKTHYMPSVVRAFAPGKLNHFFHFGSGYTSVDTACTSSLTALQQARQALLEGDCDVAVVGGGSLCVLPEPFCGLSRGGFLSPTGQCKTFQDNADGYCRGEAVGVIVLKRLDDALNDHDDVIAVVEGVVRSTNAGDVSITHPKETAQVALYEQLLRSTNTDPNEIGYVEMHGTGTIAGDTTEMNSVRQVFARGRSRDNPLHVGALKANFGHSEAAAGIVSIIKSLLILREGQIPKQPHYPFPLNRRFPDLTSLNIRIADGGSRLLPSPLGHGRTKVVVNGFDAAGGNASVLITEPPQQRDPKADSRKHHVVACSGKSSASLAANKASLAQYIRSKASSIRLADLAYTTTARRTNEGPRQAFSVSSLDELSQQLDASRNGEAGNTNPPRQHPAVVFAFSGQSTQYTGMACSLYRTCTSFQQLIDHCAAICAHYDLAPFRGILTGTQDLDRASAAQVQLAIISLQISLAQYWISLGIRPSLVIGHSLGEYAALHIGGVLSLTDTLLLVHERARAVEQNCQRSSHSMLAVAAGVETVKEIAPTCELSCVNGPSASVVSGTQAQIEQVKKHCFDLGVRTTQIQGNYAFHSSQMDSATQTFGSIAERAHFAAPQIPIASPLLGKVVLEGETFNGHYLTRHMREPVDFLGAVRSAESDSFFADHTQVIEIGPHPMCLNMISAGLLEKRPNLKFCASLSRGQDEWKCISTTLADAWTGGTPVNWKQFHQDFLKEIQLIQLPMYAWQNTEFWIPYSARHTAVKRVKQSVTFQDSRSQPTRAGLQTVESVEHKPNGRVTARFSCPTSHPQLREAIQGHMVTDVPLCPASVFMDLAFSGTRYLLGDEHKTAKISDFRIADLQMKQPLVLVEDGGVRQTIYTSAEVDQARSTVDFTFASGDRYSSAHKTLGSCEVIIESREDDIWPRVQQMVSRRVEQLQSASISGMAHRILRPVVYRLFGAVVRYTPSYQAIEEVQTDDDSTDAVATLAMSAHHISEAPFACTPYLSDALVHLAGFILNGMRADTSDTVYIANRVDNIRILASPTDGMKLVCYCCFRSSGSPQLECCDVYVYSPTGLFALFSGVHFAKMGRSFFATLIGNPISTSQEDKGQPTISSKESKAEHPSQGAAKRAENTSHTQVIPTSQETASEGLMEAFLDITAEQTGMTKDDISEWTDFASIGVDSQMSIAIAAEMRKRTGKELDAAFFISFTTIAEARVELDGPQEPGADTLDQAVKRPSGAISTESMRKTTVSSPPPSSLDAGNSQPDARHLGQNQDNMPTSDSTNVKDAGDFISAFTSGAAPTPQASEDEPCNEAQSEPLLLHGDPDSDLAPLFLIADESGEATPYLHFPALPRGRKLYAVESPFVDEPTNYDVTIEQLCSTMIKSMRRIQRFGPYILAGRSAGANMAFEIAHQLAEERHDTSNLLLINPLESHQDVFGSYDHDNTTNTVASADIEQARLKAHEAAMLAAFEDFRPKSFLEGLAPRQACFIWSRDVLLDRELNLYSSASEQKQPGSGNLSGKEGLSRLMPQTSIRHLVIQDFDRHDMLGLNPMRGKAGDIILEAMDLCTRELR